MEFDRKFEIAISCSVSLGSLESDRAYPIVHAESINTRYGQSVLVAHHEFAKQLRDSFSTKAPWLRGVVGGPGSHQFTTRGPASDLQGDVSMI